MGGAHYATLGVESDADATALRKAYRAKALQWHPDKNDSDEAEAKFKELAQAWSIVGDESKRSAYDARLRLGIDDAGADADDYAPTDWADYAEARRRAHEQYQAELARWAEEEQRMRARTRRREVAFFRRLVVGAVALVGCFFWLGMAHGHNNLLFPGPLAISNRAFANAHSLKTPFRDWTAELRATHAERSSWLERAATAQLRAALGGAAPRLDTPFLELTFQASDIKKPLWSGQPDDAVLLGSKRRVGHKLHTVWTFVQPTSGSGWSRDRHDSAPGAQRRGGLAWPPRRDGVLCVRLLKSGTITGKDWYGGLSKQVDRRLRPFGLSAVPPAECRRETGLPAVAVAAVVALIAVAAVETCAAVVSRAAGQPHR